MNTQDTLCPPAARYTYHVLTASASMPNRCKGVYRRVAVLRVDHHERDADYAPKTIRQVRGVEIVRTWERCNVGTTERGAYQIALAEAEQFATECRTSTEQAAAAA